MDYAAATAIDINTSGFAGIFLLSVCLTLRVQGRCPHAAMAR
jgi:hypothetical protein